MNVLIVSGMYPPIRTGTSFYTRNLARALRRRGHQITVATLANSDATEEERDSHYALERLPAFHAPMRGFKHFRVCSLDPRAYGRLARLAREMHANVLLLVNHYLDIAFPAIFAARQARIPLVCSVGTQLQSPKPLRHRVLNVLDRAICGTIFSFCDRIVAWDDQIRVYLRDVHGDGILDKVEVINYGVNGNEEALGGAPRDYLPKNQILGVGAVTEQRDFTALVRAFSHVASDFPAHRLKIIGHVYDDRAVRLTESLGLRDRVVFTGELPHARVLEELRASDAFFSTLTGRYIGLGTATIEAMLTGVPTIVNAYPEILGRARLEDLRHVVFPPDLSPQSIAACLRKLLADEVLRRRVGEGGRTFVQDHMNWTTVATDYERLFRGLPGSG